MPTVNVNPFNSGANYALGSCTVSGGGVNSTIAFNNARGASSGTCLIKHLPLHQHQFRFRWL